MKREVVGLIRPACNRLERCIPEGQGVEVARQALAIFGTRRARPVVEALACQPELLHRLAVELHHDRLGTTDEAGARSLLEIIAIGKAHVLHRIGPVMRKEGLALDIGLPLLRIGLAHQRFVTLLTAPARQKADAGRTLVAQDEVAVIVETRHPGCIGEGRKGQTPGQLDQHILPGPDITVRLDQRMADGVGCGIGLGDRTIEHRDRIEALEIGGVGQHQIAIADHLGVEGIRHDDEGNFEIAGLVAGSQHRLRAGGIHRGVPGHVGHEQHQRVDRIGIGLEGIADDHVHQAMGGQRALPGIGLVDAQGLTRGIDRQVFGASRKTERHSRQRGVGRIDAGDVVFGQLHRRNRLGKRRARAKVAGAVQRSEQHLDEMERATGLKAIAVRRHAAHCIHRDRPPDHLVVLHTPGIGPGNRQLDGLLEGDLRHIEGDLFDLLGRHAAAIGHRLGRILVRQGALGHQ